MSEKKIYDLRKSDYPTTRGDVFRTLQVFQCWVCGVLTNRAVMGGWPGLGVRVVCPYASECWHHELEDAIPYLVERDQRLIQEAIEKLRAETGVIIHDDVVERVDRRQRQVVTNTRSYRSGSRCPHGGIPVWVQKTFEQIRKEIK